MIDNIFLSKQNIGTIIVGLACFANDQKLHDFAITNGTFREGDLDDFIDTLQLFISDIEDDDGAILVKKINFNDIDTCHDNTGYPIL